MKEFDSAAFSTVDEDSFPVFLIASITTISSISINAATACFVMIAGAPGLAPYLTRSVIDPCSDSFDQT